MYDATKARASVAPDTALRPSMSVSEYAEYTDPGRDFER